MAAENHQPLKTRVSNLGQQLLRSRPSDTILRNHLDMLEQQWMALMCELPNSEQQLHAAQMALLPSRQALTELEIWLDEAQQEVLDSAQQVNSLTEVKLQLQKYRVRLH